MTESACEIAANIGSGQRRAVDVLEDALTRIDRINPAVNAFTDVTAERARAAAAAIDRRVAAGDPMIRTRPLLGVPYAVKNLFDIRGLPTLAGAALERNAPPAAADAVLIERLDAAGAVLVGALNMDEYAYGFSTENSHFGATHNPHDLTRIAGGSSGGSAAAVASGMLPLTLGSDTNGSIRVPASLCGVFGLKPTFGRLPRSGTYPFVHDLDHLGPFARNCVDLAVAYDVMQGYHADDASCSERPLEPVTPYLDLGVDRLRMAQLGDYFETWAGSDARAAVAQVAHALGAHARAVLPAAERARAAAFLITNAQGAGVHLDDLRSRAADFEPLSRDRFLAGALLPAAWIEQAQKVRRWFADQAAVLFADHDVLLAAATPVVAPEIGSDVLEINGQRLPMRPSLGLLTQPISAIGLPVCTVPVHGVHPTLPIGVQIIAAPWREDLVLRVARHLERIGLCTAPVAPQSAVGAR